MMKNIFAKIISATMVLTFVSSPAFADKITPTNPCKQPSRPAKFKSDAEVNSYKEQIEAYRKCINDFVEEQNQAIEKHRAAANQAITEWNFFVNSERR